MKKGVILEVHKHSITLLTPDGQFLKGRKDREHYEIGEEVNFIPFTEKKKGRLFHFEKFRVAIAASVAAALLFFTVLSFYDTKQVYAYMSIDINPSIEAGVDKKFRVISLEALNNEGKVIIDSMDESWHSQTIESVTLNILKESKEAGYYEDNAEVLIATVIVNDKGEQLESKLNHNVETMIETIKAEEVSVIAFESSMEERESAVKHGLSTGKYHQQLVTAKENASILKQEKKNVQENINKEQTKEKAISKELEKLKKEEEKANKIKDRVKKDLNANTKKQNEERKKQTPNNHSKGNQEKANQPNQSNEDKGRPGLVDDLLERIKGKKLERDKDKEKNKEKDKKDDKKGKGKNKSEEEKEEGDQ
ncbi:anti-sigma factor domain-containing protein [Bacillus salitolerans]|uniref:Anti-sigma factor domain-containing protein n=1 Tax=Bacillus salitolerans TaxID=1437434 RepID=A0ABW4LM31_9BACI